MPLADRVTDDERKELRRLIDEQQAATDALTLYQRKLAITYEVRGTDSVDPFGFITRDKTIAR